MFVNIVFVQMHLTTACRESEVSSSDDENEKMGNLGVAMALKSQMVLLDIWTTVHLYVITVLVYRKAEHCILMFLAPNDDFYY